MENAIIIGGGIGGLTTGALLSKHGYKVIVLEAGGEVGDALGNFPKICSLSLLELHLEWDMKRKGFTTKSYVI
jgi:flavin-dependent dehydrogenase